MGLNYVARNASGGPLLALRVTMRELEPVS
jgi:hypothetical protein